MNPVPHRWRNHINPWMTVHEIRQSVKHAERLYARLPAGEQKAFSREDELDRDWSKPR